VSGINPHAACSIESEQICHGMTTEHARADATGVEYLEELYSYALDLDPQPCRSRGLGTRDIRSRPTAMGRLREGSNTKCWLFTILRNVWLNQLRKWRNGPQMIQIEVGDGIADSIVEPSKDSHDLYVSKMEAEQVRAAIDELPVEFSRDYPVARI